MKDFIFVKLFFGSWIIIMCIMIAMPFEECEVIPMTYSTEWFDTEIEVLFNDGTKANYKIDVYETTDNIRVNNGNLSYTKCTKATGGVVAFNMQLASFVKSYTIIRKDFKKITN